MGSRSRLSYVVIVALAAVGIVANPPAPASTRPADRTTASCPRGYKPAVIAGNFKCLRAGQRCKMRYQIAYKKYGFRCVAGHLRKDAPKPPVPPAEPPPPPPPPPPAPPALAGHYKGLTSQLTTFEFDVTSDGFRVTNLKTGQVNAGCTPQFGLSGGEIDLGSYLMNVTTGGDFGVEYDDRGTISGGTISGTIPYTGHTKISGHFNGLTAVGSLEVTLGFSYNGVSYACGSGHQTWTVNRTG